MKFNNPRVLTTASFPETSLPKVENAYFMELYHRSEKHEGEYWYKWEKLLNRHHSRYQDYVVPAFEVSVVTYEVPTVFQPHGLDRRNALRLLNSQGLEAPSSPHAFILAEWVLNAPSYPLIPSHQCYEEMRSIVCPTPIHPEFPDFFTFRPMRTMGFYRMPYTGYGKESPFCFFRYDNGGVWRNSKEQNHIFPMVIGIKQL